MQRLMLKSKIHQAVVTEADLDYEGSITIDEQLMEAVDILPYEQVQVYNITNGSRLETYVIKGERGSGVIGITGAAARLMNKGDRIIIAGYVCLDEKEIKAHKPKIVRVNEKNQIIDKTGLKAVSN
ncbi:MAG: aspartate 1-decarboxylase [Deltaproteobacteria bacterium]|nr:MAG: aspartate 1-decarboxylase [Deltaproteobacteria bacterium]